MKIQFLLFISLFIFKLNITSQTDIAIYSNNTLNVKLKYIGKPSFLNMMGKGDSFSALPLYTPNHFKGSKIKYPKKVNKNLDEFAITEISSKNTDNNAIQQKIYLLVVNYKSKNPIIYINRDGVLDFKDENKIIDKSTRVARLDIKTKKGAVEYVIDLTKEKSSNTIISSYDTINIVNEVFFIPIWQNMIKYGTINTIADSIGVALFDANNDGVFNEKNTDMIIINSKRESKYYITSENSSAKKISAHNSIKISDSLYYDITHLDILGNFLLIETIKQNSKKNYLKIFEKIPNENFLNSDSSFVTFQSFCNKNKYVYVNILTEFCRPCIKKIPMVDSLSLKYKDKISIISLLDQGNYQDLKNLIKQFSIKSLYGLSNKEINYELHLAGYPYGVLFDKEGNVIKEIRFIDELDEFLKTHE